MEGQQAFLCGLDQNTGEEKGEEKKKGRRGRKKKGTEKKKWTGLIVDGYDLWR